MDQAQMHAIPAGLAGPKPQMPELDIVFKFNRLYFHNTMRINYTTYDIRRAQDTININSARRDIMVLSKSDNMDGADDADDSPFIYARILGIFHVNAIQIGTATPDYTPQRFDLLWVRWFKKITTGSWKKHKLECISFPPMANDCSFGFLDPNDVVRACHIVPAFSSGVRHPDSQGLSLCARDSADFCQYYVGR